MKAVRSSTQATFSLLRSKMWIANSEQIYLLSAWPTTRLTGTILAHPIVTSSARRNSSDSRKLVCHQSHCARPLRSRNVSSEVSARSSSRPTSIPKYSRLYRSTAKWPSRSQETMPWKRSIERSKCSSMRIRSSASGSQNTSLKD